MYPQQPQQPYQQPAMYPPPQPPKKTTSPWVWLAAIAVVIVALAAGCVAITSRSEPATKTTAAPAATTTTAAAVTPAGTVSSAADFTGPDRAFLATLDNPAVKAGNSSVDLVNLGRKICPRISASGKEKAMSILTEAGFSIAQATDVMYAAVVAYCPDQLTGVR